MAAKGAGGKSVYFVVSRWLLLVAATWVTHGRAMATAHKPLRGAQWHSPVEECPREYLTKAIVRDCESFARHLHIA